MKVLALWLLACAATAHAADVGKGGELYRRHCAQCHGNDGRPVLPGAPDFARPPGLMKPDTALVTTIRAGKGGMPGYAGQLREREMFDIVAHLRTLR